MRCLSVAGRQRAVVFIHRRSISHASEQTGTSKIIVSLTDLLFGYQCLLFAICCRHLTACQQCK